MITDPGIYFVRHGETEYDRGRPRFQGWNNVPLNDAGRDMSKTIASRLAKLPIGDVYSSDLSRASQTAGALVPPEIGGSATAVIRTIALRPWDIGGWTNRFEDEGIDTLRDFAFERPSEPVSDGIADGESFNDFKTRFLEHVRKAIARFSTDNVNTVHVTHSRNMELLKAAVYADPECYLSCDFPLGSIARLFHDGSDWQFKIV